MANRVVWFDVPVEDLSRAMVFYSDVLDISVEEAHGVAVLEHSGNDVAGCLFKSEDEKPSDSGVLLYFNVSGRLDEAIKAAKQCGGTVLKAKEQIGAHGYRAIVLDSEGNRVALHSE
jgi:hypothetical protein